MRQRYWPFIIFASALAIRLLGIGVESLWYDEAFTAQLVRLPFLQMIQATAADVHPPAWYLITWAFTQVLGHSEFALRVPAALFSAASVTELYLLIRKTADHKAALWVAGLTMGAAGMQYYGQEARQYSFLTWLTFTSLRSVLEDKKWRFAPAAALMLYTHNLAPLYLVPLAGLAIWKWRKQALIPLAIAGGSYAPWVIVLVRQLSAVGNSYWIAPDSIGGLIWYWVYGTLGIRMPGWLLMHGLITAVGITLASVFAMRGDLKKYMPLFAIAFLPPVELYTISQLWHPMMLPRALLPSSAGVLSLWGVGISRMNKQTRTFAALCLLPVMAVTMVNYFTDPTVQRVPADDQVSIIESNWKPGDVIYHSSVGSVVGYGYYLPDYPFFLLPGGDEIGGLSTATREALGYIPHEITIDQVVAHGYRRAFVIWSHSATTSDQQVARADAIINRYPIIKTWSLVENRLAKYRIYLLDLRAYGNTQ